ncbi:MAG: universal stress protein [Deltaproteobacteria bacterium]|nr:universal stress protein [Deltaproteobacteria bacterium]
MDFHPPGEAALAWAARLVQQVGGTLEVLHVVPRLHQLDPFFRAGSLPAATVAGIRARARARVADLLKRRVHYRVHVIEGEPAACIVERAVGLRVELIVIGTRARRGAAQFLFGSVAQKVIQHAPVPVVTIRCPRPG